MIGCSGSIVIQDGNLIKESVVDKKEIPHLFEEFDKDKNIVSVVLMGNFKGILIDLIHFPKIFTPFALLGLKMQGAYYEFSRFGRKRINKILFIHTIYSPTVNLKIEFFDRIGCWNQE